MVLHFSLRGFFLFDPGLEIVFVPFTGFRKTFCDSTSGFLIPFQPLGFELETTLADFGKISRHFHRNAKKS